MLNISEIGQFAADL